MTCLLLLALYILLYLQNYTADFTELGSTYFKYARGINTYCVDL